MSTTTYQVFLVDNGDETGGVIVDVSWKEDSGNLFDAYGTEGGIEGPYVRVTLTLYGVSVPNARNENDRTAFFAACVRAATRRHDLVLVPTDTYDGPTYLVELEENLMEFEEG